MISVPEAIEHIVRGFEPLPAETVGLDAALGRVLAEDTPSRLTQPPVAVSAMDGYAVRAADVPAPRGGRAPPPPPGGPPPPPPAAPMPRRSKPEKPCASSPALRCPKA